MRPDGQLELAVADVLRARRRVAARAPHTVDLDSHRHELPGVETAPELVGAQTQRHASRLVAAHLEDLRTQLVQGEARPDELEIAVDAMRCGERLQQARSGEAASEVSPM